MIKENWVEVKTYKATAYCDKCKEGKMIPTGILKTSNPLSTNISVLSVRILETLESRIL